MDIIFKSRHTDVLDRFRKHATAKLAKIGRLDRKAIRIDVEVSAERNPRQSERRERVELTISSRGPAIRAEAAAEDRFAALDVAFAKLESRLRRARDRRKSRHGAHAAARSGELPGTDLGGGAGTQGSAATVPVVPPARHPDQNGPADAVPDDEGGQPGDVIAIEMQGEGPLVVREKFHGARPMVIDQALFEMELVGHDFFLFRDVRSGHPSVVYRRRGYQYGVIRLVEEASAGPAGDAAEAPASGRANGQVRKAATLEYG